MKMAFRHPQSEHASQLLRGLTAVLVGHELLSWPLENTAPALDIRVVLALGALARAQLEPLSQLELVQTVSAGFESIDVDAASEMGIWVSNAPAGLTGNAASVAEFAVMLLIGADVYKRQPRAVSRPAPEPKRRPLHPRAGRCQTPAPI